MNRLNHQTVVKSICLNYAESGSTKHFKIRSGRSLMSRIDTGKRGFGMNSESELRKLQQQADMLTKTLRTMLVELHEPAINTDENASQKKIYESLLRKLADWR